MASPRVSECPKKWDDTDRSRKGAANDNNRRQSRVNVWYKIVRDHFEEYLQREAHSDIPLSAERRAAEMEDLAHIAQTLEDGQCRGPHCKDCDFPSLSESPASISIPPGVECAVNKQVADLQREYCIRVTSSVVSIVRSQLYRLMHKSYYHPENDPGERTVEDLLSEVAKFTRGLHNKALGAITDEEVDTVVYRHTMHVLSVHEDALAEMEDMEARVHQMFNTPF